MEVQKLRVQTLNWGKFLKEGCWFCGEKSPFTELLKSCMPCLTWLATMRWPDLFWWVNNVLIFAHLTWEAVGARDDVGKAWVCGGVGAVWLHKPKNLSSVSLHFLALSWVSMTGLGFCFTSANDIREIVFALSLWWSPQSTCVGWVSGSQERGFAYCIFMMPHSLGVLVRFQHLWYKGISQN